MSPVSNIIDTIVVLFAMLLVYGEEVVVFCLFAAIIIASLGNVPWQMLAIIALFPLWAGLLLVIILVILWSIENKRSSKNE